MVYVVATVQAAAPVMVSTILEGAVLRSMFVLVLVVAQVGGAAAAMVYRIATRR